MELLRRRMLPTSPEHTLIPKCLCARSRTMAKSCSLFLLLGRNLPSIFTYLKSLWVSVGIFNLKSFLPFDSPSFLGSHPGIKVGGGPGKLDDVPTIPLGLGPVGGHLLVCQSQHPIAVVVVPVFGGLNRSLGFGLCSPSSRCLGLGGGWCRGHRRRRVFFHCSGGGWAGLGADWLPSWHDVIWISYVKLEVELLYVFWLCYCLQWFVWPEFCDLQG